MLNKKSVLIIIVIVIILLIVFLGFYFYEQSRMINIDKSSGYIYHLPNGEYFVSYCDCYGEEYLKVREIDENSEIKEVWNIMCRGTTTRTPSKYSTGGPPECPEEKCYTYLNNADIIKEYRNPNLGTETGCPQ